MFKVKIVFGQTASGYVDDVITAVVNAEEENPDGDKFEAGAKELMSWGDHEALNITEKEFETEAECHAYLMGVYDGEGWMGYYVLEDDQAELLEKVMEAKEKVTE